MKMMKTRFSPSPTGQMHLGNVRTALFNVLLAHHAKGHFVLRIEDTDQVRSKAEFTEMLMTDLKWLYLNWDEEPVHQSQRQAIYKKYYDELIAEKKVYPCFCTDEQLALSRKIQLSQSKPPRYLGTCRNLTKEDIAQKTNQGLKPTLRFQVPLGEEVAFDDLVKGSQKFKTDDIGDFIIRRGDESASFFFCNAIDDAVMGVTHALRGEDHLTNTPRQILILNALKLPIPHYGHIALIIGNDGSKLSKRHGSKSLQELREEGFLPIAVNNYLGRVGHYYEQNNLMTMDELSHNFSIKHIGTTPAHFDQVQLLHWQKLAVMQLSDEEFWNWIKKPAIVLEHKKTDFIHFMRPNILFPSEAQEWANILFGTIKKQDIPADFIKTAKNIIQDVNANYADVIGLMRKELNINGKTLFHPLRMAITGKEHGPDLRGIFQLMGKDGLLKRLNDI